MISTVLRRADAFTREPFYRLKLGQLDRSQHITPEISIHGDFSAFPESLSVRQSLDRAIDNIGGPPDYIRQIEGMSGQKYRTFINTLVGLTKDARYLEVGSWRGSTAASALYGNQVKALCIDNWSQFGGPKHAFLNNMERVKSNLIEFQFTDMDFRRVDYNWIGTFNLFLFDGPHEERDQYDGIMYTMPAMDDVFVLIVDDWNLYQAQLGTFRAIRDARYSVVSSVEIRTTRDNSEPQLRGSRSDWHNGYFICVISRSSFLDRRSSR